MAPISDITRKKLGEAFGFEAMNRQGKSSMKRRAEKIDRDRSLASAVEARYRKIGDEEGESLASIISIIASGSGVSDDVVERAYAAHRRAIERNLLGVERMREIVRKTSRSGAVED